MELVYGIEGVNYSDIEGWAAGICYFTIILFSLFSSYCPRCLIEYAFEFITPSCRGHNVFRSNAGSE